MKQNLKLIQSSDNPRFKTWAALTHGRKARKLGQFLLSGRKLVPELLKTHPSLFSELLVPTNGEVDFAIPENLKVFGLEGKLFRELDILGTDFPLLVGDTPNLSKADLDRQPQGLELLCGLGDPNNLGAVLRSAEAFGASKVILLSEAASPFHPRALRASAGSSLRLKLELGPSISQVSGSVYALDMGGAALENFQWPRNLRLLMGEEGQGIPSQLSEVQKISIAMNPRVESLNAMAATSIALYCYRQQHSL